MPGLHWELLLPLLAILLLFFGAKRLPEIGSAAGQTIKEFQKAFKSNDDSETAALPPAPTTSATTAAPTAPETEPTPR